MISAFRKFLDLIIVIAILISSGITRGAEDTDIQTIRQNITEGLLSGELGVFNGSDLKTADDIIARTVTDDKGYFYFNDINYADTSRAGWQPSRHLARTEQLTLLWAKETDEAARDTLEKYIFGLLDHWIAEDYQCSNWWYNKLSNPICLGEIGVLMKDELSGKRLRDFAELVGRGCFLVNSQVRSHTGANAIDIAMSSIEFGVITNSRRAIKDAVKRVSGELAYSEDEGLRADSTFFQHGERLYMGGYGVEFISGMANLILMLDGTEYNFAPDMLTNFSDFILDGMRIMSFGSTLDPTTMGRSVSRQNAQPLKSIIAPLTKLAKAENFPRRDEIRAYISSISQNTRSDYGVNWFDEAKFLVINNSDFYFSFRGGADYLAYAEIINDENVLGYNSSFPGVTTIMHTGSEYNNISPVMDFAFVPGTTAVYETDEELFAHEDFTYRYLKGIYGSAQKEGAAIASVKTEHEGIKMTVTCFATDRAAFLLGAGMTDSKGRPMNTTLNQCFSAGDFTQNGNTVIHNGIKYTLMEGGTLTARSEHRVGNYHRNNLTYGTAPVEGEIFTVSFENNGSYAYAVMGENTDEAVEVIVNTEAVQAVRMPDGTVAAAFFENTSFTYNGRTFTGNAGDTLFF